MMRFAPGITLLAIAVAAGGLLVATASSNPAATASPVAAAETQGRPGGSTEIAISDLPLAGIEPGAEPEGITSQDVPPPDADGPRAERKEISLANVPLVVPPEAPAAPEADEPEAAAPDVPGAPAPPAPVEDSAYAGETDDGKLTVAVAVADGGVVAYLCDGDTIEIWFKGTMKGAWLDVAPTEGDASMTGTVDGDGIEGIVVVNGVEMAYSADVTKVVDAVRAGRDDVADVAERVGL